MSEISFRLNKPQTLALRAVRRNNTICLPWGRGVGKSFFMRLNWWLQVAEWDGRYRPGATRPGVRIVLLMPTLEQAKKVHAKDMLDELEGDWSFLGGVVNRSDWRVTFPGGSWIQWVTAERARGSRGIRCDVVCVDEADDVPADVVDAVVVPWFSEAHSLAITIVAGTPTRGRQGLLYRTHKRGLDQEPNAFTFHATYRDAPETVDPAKVVLARKMPPAYFKREWECDFDSAEGLVYPMFSEAIHVRPYDPKTRPTEVLVGCDWGFVDPTVFIAVAVTGHGNDAACHVIDEHYVTQETYEPHLAVAMQWRARWPQAKWFGDPSGPALIAQYCADAGVNMVGAINDIEDGIYAVSHWLNIIELATGAKYTRLLVDPKCKNLIREFGLYRRKRDPSDRDRILERPEDKNNHATDALRYALRSRFEPPSRRIEIA